MLGGGGGGGEGALGGQEGGGGGWVERGVRWGGGGGIGGGVVGGLVVGPIKLAMPKKKLCREILMGGEQKPREVSYWSVKTKGSRTQH